MKIDLVRPILVLVILALAFGWMWQCESGKKVEQIQDLTAFRTTIDRLRSDSARSRGRLVLEQSKSKVSQIALKREIGIRDKTLAEVRVEIAVLMDSLPVVKRYVDAADSSINVRDSLINHLETTLGVQSKLYQEQISAMAARHISTVELSETYRKQVEELQKQVRKQTRRKKFWRAVAMILGATTAVLILAK
jgi:archaellum component FlaC